MAVMQPPQTPQGCTNTSIEGTVKQASLPNPDNKPYLMEKANYASRFPKLSIKKAKDGGVTGLELKQLVMSGLIRADEYRWDFRWDYKAEVCFDMASLPPKPFLSSSWIGNDEKPDPERRHTLFPFPKGSVKGLLRRPDVIIVKDRSIRWPGQAGTDHQTISHPDNLERLVEVKFPGDKLYPDQERAYLLIAGGRRRFSVLEINWLTILGKDFVELLEGEASLRRAFSGRGDIEFISYESGLIIRAGEYPELGKLESGPPPSYIAVNNVVKQLRIKNPDQLHPYSPYGDGFEEESTARWYARFDQEAPQPKTPARLEAGQPCSAAGYWFSPAKTDSRQYFSQGEILPSFSDSNWGDTLWYWSSDRRNDRDGLTSAL